MQKQYTYLALGDSYTIGEAVLLQQSFPYQVVQLFRQQGFSVAAPEIVAKTGWTTEELLAGMADYVFSPKYNFVSLLIGVNNQYRGQQIILYKQQFELLLKRCIQLAGGKKDHVFVLTIPDYSVTPFAKDLDMEKISKEIDEYNNLIKALCIQYKVCCIDNTEGKRLAKEQPELLAEDGLHPSPKEYTAWAERLSETVMKLFKK
jgi:lysophospholipase L1-like esterase